jgi:hypothetical protein
MANRRKKPTGAAKSAPRRAASPRKSAIGGPPLWLIFTGLVAAGAVVYFIAGQRGSSGKAEPLQEKVSQMAEENPDAEIFQVKEEPAPKASEKKK